MIHPLIDHLHQRHPLSHWLFLLTAYELSPMDWIERRTVLDRLSITKNPSNVSDLTQVLEALKFIETEKKRPANATGPTRLVAHIRLTRHARDELKAAFQLAALASKSTTAPVPA